MHQETKESPPPSAKGDGPAAQRLLTTANIIPQTGEECKPNYWAIVPAGVRYDPELPANAKLLYGELTALTQAKGFCWANNNYFAQLYGLTEDRISRLFVLLEKRGYITREIVRDEKTKVVIGRKIWLYQMPAAVTEPPGNNTEATRQKYRDPPGKNVEGNNINNNTIPPVVPQRVTAKAGEQFERFWKLYPPRNGVRRGKAEARKQWERLGAERDPVLCRQILTGLDAYKQSADVARGYAVDAVRWLRNRRWEDEQVAPTEDAPASLYDAGVSEDLLEGLWDGG